MPIWTKLTVCLSHFATLVARVRPRKIQPGIPNKPPSRGRFDPVSNGFDSLAWKLDSLLWRSGRPQQLWLPVLYSYRGDVFVARSHAVDGNQFQFCSLMSAVVSELMVAVSRVLVVAVGRILLITVFCSNSSVSEIPSKASSTSLFLLDPACANKEKMSSSFYIALDF